MADEAPKHNPMQDVYFFIAFLVIVVILWFAAGGPGKADLRGAFLQAPPPLSNGQAYGPGGTSTQQQPTFDNAGSVQQPGQVTY